MDRSEQPVRNREVQRIRVETALRYELCLALDSYKSVWDSKSEFGPVLFRVLSRYNVRQSCKTVTIPVFRSSLYPLIQYSVRCLLWLLCFDSEPYCFSKAHTFVPALRLVK